MIEAYAGPGWTMPCPSVNVEFNDRGVHVNDTVDGVTIQLRYAGFVPFELSLVVSELWDFLLHDSFGMESHYKVHDQSPNEAFGHLTLRQSVSGFPGLAMEGPSALRRVLTPDGSVLFAAASSAAGSVPSSVFSSDASQTQAFDIHKSSWLRVGRNSTAPSLVYIESHTHIEIHPTGTATCKLDQVCDALLRSSRERGPRNTQRLENRLLDATRARGKSVCV